MPDDLLELEVLCFAAVRDVAGASSVALRVARPASVASVRAALLARFPVLEARSRSLRFAVNGTYAVDADPVADGDEVAVIPPVSGG